MCKILSRIKEIADREGVTITTIERTIGASRGVISKALSKGTDIQSKWLESVCENFPQYSARWLLTGEGNMLRGKREKGEIHIETRPRIPFDAAAGALSLISDSISEDQCERFPIITRFPNYDFTIMVRGDSMEPEFLSGDEIACRFINERSFIQWGRPHVLDTTQGVILKRIYERKGSILCRSSNPDYEDFEVPKNDILHIALVVGNVRIY